MPTPKIEKTAGSDTLLPRSSRWYFPLALTALVAALYFLAQERIGISYTDEGYLWYGVQRVLAGEVPIRDFLAYDPGRYYWAAAWCFFLGDSLFDVRIANLAFAAGGIFLSLLAVRSVVRSPLAIVLVAAALFICLYPRHKMYEHGLAMMAVFAGTELLRRHSLRSVFFCGVLVGVAAIFGRNHGVYFAVAFAALVLLLRVKGIFARRRRPLVALALGTLAGYGPMLLMLLVIPNFFDEFWNSLVSLLSGTTSQLSKAIPWPGTQDLSSVAPLVAAHRLVVGGLFAIMPLTYASVIIVALRSRPAAIPEHALVVSAAFVGLCGFHHALARPDFAHLAQVIHPWLLCVVGLLASSHGRYRWSQRTILLAMLVAAVIFCYVPHGPLYRRHQYTRNPNRTYVTRAIGNRPLQVRDSVDRHLAQLEELALEHARGPQSLFVAPHYPAFYAHLGKRAPWKETYFLFPRDSDWQSDLIRSLERNDVSLILISPEATADGREDLKFPNTHPEVWAYIQRHYQHVPEARGPAGTQVFLPR